jgi:UDP-N-acetylglucosamine 2-epimerase (non-hydrolysing)
MKILTVLGTRPEIIRLSLLIRLLDEHVEHTLVHTGQNTDDRLSGLFFRELGVRDPDTNLGVRETSFGAQVGAILAKIEPILLDRRPDRVLVLGDTNSGLVAIVARRLGIPVCHMEAGNRCYDDRVPEEVNRRIIDHASSVLLPYTERSRANLLREGIPSERVYVTGNPIREVLDHHAPAIAASRVLTDLELAERKFFLVTIHRAENVDREDTLRSLIDGLGLVQREFGLPVICSLHPRTKAKVEQFGVELDVPGLRFVPPLGFFDFVHLERSARCVLTDSGTVQEETCILGVPNVTLREVTERPETLECGSNMLAGTDPESILNAVSFVLNRGGSWTPPPEYQATHVAQTAFRIVTGHRMADAAELEWRQGLRIRG